MSGGQRFESDIPEGTHLDASRSSDGAYRGTLRDNATNRLVGHAEWRLIEEDDDAAEGEEDSDLSGLVGGLIAGVLVVGAGLGLSHARKLRRRKKAEQQFQIETAAVEHQVPSTNERILPPADWYEDAAGRMRWWDGKNWTEHVQRPETRETASHAEKPGPSAGAQTTVVSATGERAQTTMSSAEWQERVRAMLLARAFSEEQWILLSNARIMDADPVLLESQQTLRTLTPQEFSDFIIDAIRRNPQLLGNAALPSSGWYDDGLGDIRWWDSLRWTEHVHMAAIEVKAPEALRALASPGWYDDGSGRQRWWTGQHWA